MADFQSSSEPGRPSGVLSRISRAVRFRGYGLGLAVAALALAAAPVAEAQCEEPCSPECRADLDGSGSVGASDLARLLGAWGPCVGCFADIDGSGMVDAADLSLMLAVWGGSCGSLPWATVLEQNPDPAVVTDAALRNAIIATGYPWRVRDNGTGIEMVLIPPGTFNMGCSASNAYGCGAIESPVHSVTLTSAFYMGRYEVTQAEWQARVGTNPSYFTSASAQVPAAQVPNRPVEQVTWNMIAGAGGFLSGSGLRLPTEAEWEYAYRAGTTTAFHGFTGSLGGTNDDTLVGNIAWVDSNALSQTRPVGGKLANGYGLHDMSGNVVEWVNDWWSSSYYASSPSTNPTGPASGIYRVQRGGSWNYDTELVRSSFRDGRTPDEAYIYSGFRVARNPV